MAFPDKSQPIKSKDGFSLNNGNIVLPTPQPSYNTLRKTYKNSKI